MCVYNCKAKTRLIHLNIESRKGQSVNQQWGQFPPRILNWNLSSLSYYLLFFYNMKIVTTLTMKWFHGGW